jgi:hypothetical protein
MLHVVRSKLTATEKEEEGWLVKEMRSGAE